MAGSVLLHGILDGTTSAGHYRNGTGGRSSSVREIVVVLIRAGIRVGSPVVSSPAPAERRAWDRSRRWDSLYSISGSAPSTASMSRRAARWTRSNDSARASGVSAYRAMYANENRDVSRPK